MNQNFNMNVWMSPIRILVLYLALMAVWATVGWSGTDVNLYLTLIRNVALLYGCSWLTYQGLLKFSLIQPTRWEHRIISCLIIYLLFDSLIPWWVFISLGVVTEVLQRFVRFPTGPLANPAALGSLVIGALTGCLPTWWATNFGPRREDMLSLAFCFTLPIAGYVAYKYKKLWIVLAGVISTAIASFVILQNSPLYLLVDGTLAFFLLVMATEPKTSPVLRNQQLLYGGVVGALVIVGLHSAWLEQFTMPLVLANVIFNLYRNQMTWMKWLRPQAVQPASSVPPATN